jgi:hypothetical protein
VAKLCIEPVAGFCPRAWSAEASRFELGCSHAQLLRLTSLPLIITCSTQSDCTSIAEYSQYVASVWGGATPSRCMPHLCRTLLRLLSKDLHRINRTFAAAPYTDTSIIPSIFPRTCCRTHGESELVGSNRQRWPNCVSWMVGGRRRPQVQQSMRRASASTRRVAPPCLCIALLVSAARSSSCFYPSFQTQHDSSQLHFCRLR